LQVELLAESNIKNMSSIVELPEQRLDAALANLADRLLPDNGKNHVETKFPDVKKAFLGVDSMALKADFVATLKAGIEEFKAQLSQGHLPSFDLTALVSDSYANVTGTQVSSPQLSATLNRFTQTLDVSSLLNAGSESSLVINTLEKITSKENLTQSHILQNKHGQQLAQFDKAVNITRNEGIVQMAEKVRWLVNQHNLQAEIRLDPPDLGAMKVRVNMAGDAVTVNIVVQSQQAREVLEQATPKLKELLEQQGIELGQSSVQEEQTGNETASGEQFAGSGEQSQTTETEDSEYIEQPIREGRLGGIDYFV
jgi:flagellar hook-length control protein FliK